MDNGRDLYVFPVKRIFQEFQRVQKPMKYFAAYSPIALDSDEDNPRYLETSSVQSLANGLVDDRAEGLVKISKECLKPEDFVFKVTFAAPFDAYMRQGFTSVAEGTFSEEDRITFLFHLKEWACFKAEEQRFARDMRKLMSRP